MGNAFLTNGGARSSHQIVDVVLAALAKGAKGLLV
jgi:hypothetical protein